MFRNKRQQREIDALMLRVALLQRDNNMLRLKRTHETLLWNTLVQRINAAGGEDFLLRGEAKLKASQFDDADLRRLLQLCHPDKHGGSATATEMTRKLLKARA